MSLKPSDKLPLRLAYLIACQVLVESVFTVTMTSRLSRADRRRQTVYRSSAQMRCLCNFVGPLVAKLRLSLAATEFDEEVDRAGLWQNRKSYPVKLSTLVHGEFLTGQDGNSLGRVG